MFIGAVSAARIARRATPFTTPPFQIAASRTDILVSGELLIPLTCGFLHSRILLPAAAEHWSSSRLAAVLSHELAHVRRRDIAAQMAAHFIAALWWFQPLVWILRRALREESELACDAEAVRSGLRPSGYAAELLAVAKTIGRNYRFSSSAIHMVRSGPLEKRVRAILNPPAVLLRPQRTYALIFALGSIAIASSALTLSPTNTFNPQGTSTMKRTILSALLTSLSLSAATVSGTISDQSGAPVPDVKVLVYNPDTGAKQDAVTGSDGKFSIAGDAAGQYILRMEKPGFTSLFREFDLKADSSVAREFTMTNEGGEQVADKLISTNEEQTKPLRVGGAVAQNNVISRVQPVYPAAAKEAHTQGVVEIQATISKDGVPIELRVLSSPSDDLSQSALEAVRQWRYRPTLLNGAPVEIVTTVIVNYTLSE
jgi:TonB family protein